MQSTCSFKFLFLAVLVIKLDSAIYEVHFVCVCVCVYFSMHWATDDIEHNGFCAHRCNAPEGLLSAVIGSGGQQHAVTACSDCSCIL